jgi:hypothetical protein
MEDKATETARHKLYFDYAKKSKIEGSYHALIYGAIIDKDVVETELFKRYSLYLYGYAGGEKFIGFEYGRIHGLYDKLHYSYGDKLSLTQSKVPEEIKLLFKETYPKLKGSSHAIIQNVDCSHYTSGNIMHGYWINMNNINDDNADKISDISMGANMETYGFNNLEITSVGHNMTDTNSSPSEFFIGVTLKRFTPNEGETDHKKLARQLSKTYYAKNSKLPERDIILKVLHNIDPNITIIPVPMLCLIQGMCYCCT